MCSSMDSHAKMRLADEIHAEQPHLFGSVLVQRSLGVSLRKMELSFELLFITFLAMRNSRIDWPCISEDDQDRQLARTTGMVKFSEGLTPELQLKAITRYVQSHPEQEFLSYITGRINEWLLREIPEESDKYVMLAAYNMVNCLSHVSLPARSGRQLKIGAVKRTARRRG